MLGPPRSNDLIQTWYVRTYVHDRDWTNCHKNIIKHNMGLKMTGVANNLPGGRKFQGKIQSPRKKVFPSFRPPNKLGRVKRSEFVCYKHTRFGNLTNDHKNIIKHNMGLKMTSVANNLPGGRTFQRTNQIPTTKVFPTLLPPSKFGRVKQSEFVWCKHTKSGNLTNDCKNAENI